MIKVAVIGARGYTGAELLPLLHRHPRFELVAIGSASAAGETVNAHVSGMDDCQLEFQAIGPAGKLAASLRRFGAAVRSAATVPMAARRTRLRRAKRPSR